MPIDLQPPEPAALMCAIMAGSGNGLECSRGRLEAMFGSVPLASAVYSFDCSTYYHREMGPGLVKQLVCFAERLEPHRLAAVKRRTMELERRLACRTCDGVVRRRVNVDPGLVTVESLVLATTKYSGHRVCIARGLYAEVTLLFRRGGCSAFEWTYPDYRTAPVQDFLLRVRGELLLERRRNADGGTGAADE